MIQHLNKALCLIGATLILHVQLFQVENSGDPWKADSARKDNFTYFDSVWLTMVTMSTGSNDKSVVSVNNRCYKNQKLL